MNRPDAYQHMNVIRPAIDDQGAAVHFADDAAEIGEQVGPEFGLDQRAAFASTEDQMEQDVAARMRYFLRPSGGWHVFARLPTAHAVGCILAPLRGCSRSQLRCVQHYLVFIPSPLCGSHRSIYYSLLIR